MIPFSRVKSSFNARAAALALSENVATLQASDPRGPVEVVNGDALEWLAACAPVSLDVVFLDPPFGSGMDKAALQLLRESGALAEDGLVYFENARQDRSLDGINGWETVRDKTQGEVRMRLLKKI